MATLVAGQPLRTRTPTLLVENRLAVGRVAFELVVVDDQGNVSPPVRLVVTVGPAGRPPVPAPAPLPMPV